MNLPAMWKTKADMSLISRLGRSLGEGNGSPLQYSCLENSTDRGAWWSTVHRVTKSWTWLKWRLHAQFHDATPWWPKNKRTVFLIQLKLKTGVPDQQWLISRRCFGVLVPNLIVLPSRTDHYWDLHVHPYQGDRRKRSVEDHAGKMSMNGPEGHTDHW